MTRITYEFGRIVAGNDGTIPPDREIAKMAMKGSGTLDTSRLVVVFKDGKIV